MEFCEHSRHYISRQAGEEGVAGVGRDDDPVSGEVAEEGAGLVKTVNLDGGTEEDVEDGGVRGPVLEGVDEVLDEMAVRLEAFTNKLAGEGGAGG